MNNFDNTHPEGADITDYFKIAQSYQTIEDYVTDLHYNYATDLDIIDISPGLKIDLLLMVAPTADNKQQFKIRVALSDRRILEQQTPEIELL